MKSFKQVLVLRSDLGMSEGKKIVQACHASIGAYKRADKNNLERWEEQGMKKVVLTVKDEEELEKNYKHAKTKGIPVYMVRDAGLTELEPNTATCVGIGPGSSREIDKVTGNLETL